MMRDNIKMGKSLVDVEKAINKESESGAKDQKDDKGKAAEKVNKFDKFREKRDSKADPDVLGNFDKMNEKMSKEERAKS